MVVHGHIQGGVIVTNESIALPEGAAVRIEILSDRTTSRSAPTFPSTRTGKPRHGRGWKALVVIADEIVELPADMTEAFGMNSR